MKYGYMFYQKPLIPTMKNRPINIGDPIQSYAVKKLYLELGIPKEDIIPIPRYDMALYGGEECICVVNTASNYEELAYGLSFLPPSKNLHAIPMSLHIHRKLLDDELNFYHHCTEVGCRDRYTVNYLKSLGINAYLSGCLTLTFPRRSEEQAKNANKIYFIDIDNSLESYIPKGIRELGIKLSNVIRYNNPGIATRISVEETYKVHMEAEKRIDLLRDTAKLVVTSRLHIASPCLAMGIPVILAKKHFGDRFGFIDCFLPTYTPEKYNDIDWSPSPINFEEEKAKIKNLFFSKVVEATNRIELDKVWHIKKPIYKLSSETAVAIAIKNNLPMFNPNIKYAVWGTVLDVAFYLEEAMNKLLPHSTLVAGIDIASTNTFCGVPTIHPDNIKNLDNNVVIMVAAPSAQESAKKLLIEMKHNFILVKETELEFYNFDNKN